MPLRSTLENDLYQDFPINRHCHSWPGVCDPPLGVKEDERGSLYEGQKSVEESSRNKAKCLENIQKQDKFEGCSHVKRRAKRSYGGIAYAKAASKLWPGATTVIPRVEALIGLDTADTCSTPEGTGEVGYSMCSTPVCPGK